MSRTGRRGRGKALGGGDWMVARAGFIFQFVEQRRKRRRTEEEEEASTQVYREMVAKLRGLFRREWRAAFRLFGSRLLLNCACVDVW